MPDSGPEVVENGEVALIVASGVATLCTPSK